MSPEPAYVERMPVLLIGGGAINSDALRVQLGKGWRVYAADGGADALRDLGVIPKAIIGDMDSIRDLEFWRSKTTLFPIQEQDTTDFEKCLSSIQSPCYLCFGFLGARFDHSLAAMHVLAKYVDRSCYLFGDHDLVFARNGPVAMDLPIGSRLSIFPLTPVKFSKSEGLAYPLKGLEMAMDTAIGTSNRTTAKSVVIDSEQGNYAVMVDVEHADRVITSKV